MRLQGRLDAGVAHEDKVADGGELARGEEWLEKVSERAVDEDDRVGGVVHDVGDLLGE